MDEELRYPCADYLRRRRDSIPSFSGPGAGNAMENGVRRLRNKTDRPRMRTVWYKLISDVEQIENHQQPACLQAAQRRLRTRSGLSKLRGSQAPASCRCNRQADRHQQASSRFGHVWNRVQPEGEILRMQFDAVRPVDAVQRRHC